MTRLFEAQRLKSECAEVARDFRRSYLRRKVQSALDAHPNVELGDLMTRSRLEVELKPTVSYSGVGTRMWGEGLYVHEVKKGSDFNAERYALRTGQLVYNEVWAHNGAIGVLTEVFDHPVVSRHFHVFDLDHARVRPGYLRVVFRSPWFWAQCQTGSVGTSGRGHMRRRHLEQIRIPLPSLDEQRKIEERVADLDRLLQQVEERQQVLATVLEPLVPASLGAIAAPGPAQASSRVQAVG